MKLAWPIAPLFLFVVIGKSVNDVKLTDIYQSFYIIIGVFVLLGLLAIVASLPEVSADGEYDDEVSICHYSVGKTSIWQFLHFLLGVLALFVYVGVEVISLGTLIDYAESIGLSNPEAYAWIAPIGMVIGYVGGIILIPEYISQALALKIVALIALFGSLMVVLMPEGISIYFIFFIALGCSLMWPALWPLAMQDLGRFTKTGSSLMVIAIVGGALFPLFYGFLKDIVGAQDAYWLVFPGFLYMSPLRKVGGKI
jgi:fucose permease